MRLLRKIERFPSERSIPNPQWETAVIKRGVSPAILKTALDSNKRGTFSLHRGGRQRRNNQKDKNGDYKNSFIHGLIIIIRLLHLATHMAYRRFFLAFTSRFDTCYSLTGIFGKEDFNMISPMYTGLKLLLNLSFILIITLGACTSDYRAERFNRLASSPESMPGRTIDSLDIRQGQTVADLGAGGGYYALQFARKVGPRGRVYAVDINLKFLDYIARRADEAGIRNLEAVLADEDNSRLPDSSIDIVFMRNVFHHLPGGGLYFKKLSRILKPGGKIAVIEYKKTGGFSLSGLLGHTTPEEEIVTALTEAGYDRAECFDFLPRQSFNVFVLKK
jgi:precorrin-6B methylase 2